MPRVMIVAAGQGYKKLDCIELTAAQITALGSAARAVTGSAGGVSPTGDQLGEPVAASNSTG